MSKIENAKIVLRKWIFWILGSWDLWMLKYSCLQELKKFWRFCSLFIIYSMKRKRTLYKT